VFFELRQYRTIEGKRDEWVRFMEEVIIPFQTSKGMVIVGNFICPDEPDLYIWMRRFASEEERQQLYKAVYESPVWVNEISPRIPTMLDRERIIVTCLEPTPKSVIH